MEENVPALIEKFKDSKELEKELAIRIDRLNELECLVNGEKPIEDVDTSWIDRLFSDNFDAEKDAQALESFKWEDLKPKEAEVIATKIAQKVRESVKGMKGFEERTFWFMSIKKGDEKEIIQSTQSVVRFLTMAVAGNATALSRSFQYQQELASFSQFLLLLGCYNIAMNTAILEDLDKALKQKETINKKRLSERTKENLKVIFQRLKDQQNILQQQDRLSKQQGELQEKLDRKVDKDTYENSKREIEDLKRKQSECASTTDVEDKIGQLRTHIGQKVDAEEFRHKLSVEKKEFITLKESSEREIVSLKEEINFSKIEYRKLFNKLSRTIIIFSILVFLLITGLVISFLI